LFDLNVEFAAFEVDSARCLLRGEEITFVGPGFIDFTDHRTGQIDILSFSGAFRRLGTTVEIGSAVSLPIETLQFFKDVERPPRFEPTLSVFQTAYGVPGPYVGLVARGEIVSAVPEPALLPFLLANMFFVAFRERR
jgi:hypothetical protein